MGDIFDRKEAGERSTHVMSVVEHFKVIAEERVINPIKTGIVR